MKKALLLSIAALGVSTLSGCSTLSGFDAGSEFACDAPVGVSCASVSGVYANAKAGNLPSQKVGAEKFRHLDRDGEEVGMKNDSEGANEPVQAVVQKKSIVGNAPASETPLYTQAKVMRVWFAPWEDRENMLHDQSYVYMTVQKGRWDIEHLSKEVAADSRLSTQKLYR